MKKEENSKKIIIECDKDIDLEIKVKKDSMVPEQEEFIISGYKYTGPDRVEFFEPFDPPIEPRTWHLFWCVDSTGAQKTKGKYPGKFDPVGEGELVRPDIRNETKAKVDSREWHWKAIKIQ